jgi:hypothetical protein
MRPKLRRGLPGANAPARPWEKEQKERLEAQRALLKAEGGIDSLRSTGDPQTFDGPSKPRAVYTRPNRELPVFKVSGFVERGRMVMAVRVATLAAGWCE